MTDEALIALEAELDARAEADAQRKREAAAEAERAAAEREAEEVRAGIAAMSDDERAEWFALGEKLRAEGHQTHSELIAYQSSMITTPMRDADMGRGIASSKALSAVWQIEGHLRDFIAASDEIAAIALESGFAPPSAEPHAEQLKQIAAQVSAAVEEAIKSLRIGFPWSAQERRPRNFPFNRSKKR